LAEGPLHSQSSSIVPQGVLTIREACETGPQPHSAAAAGGCRVYPERSCLPAVAGGAAMILQAGSRDCRMTLVRSHNNAASLQPNISFPVILRPVFGRRTPALSIFFFHDASGSSHNTGGCAKVLPDSLVFVFLRHRGSARWPAIQRKTEAAAP